MKKIESMDALEKFGRVRLSDNFFMRDFLYSEISNFYKIPNIPDNPELAIAAGEKLCNELLEPLKKKFGHITIRSAYRSCAVNQFGNENKLNCSSNERTYADHIWDKRNKEGFMGATACVQIPWFADRFEQGRPWQSLAWWIHDHLPYHSQFYFPIRAALNLTWRENPERWIRSYIGTGGKYLTKQGMDNWSGSHKAEYQWIEDELK